MIEVSSCTSVTLQDLFEARTRRIEKSLSDLGATDVHTDDGTAKHRFLFYPNNSLTGSPVRSSSELAIFTGRPMGLMYSFPQSIPSVL